MKGPALIFILVTAHLGLAQQLPVPQPSRPIRFAVNHADPWMIVALLEGRRVVSPEMSTLFNAMGMPQQVEQGLNRLFQGRFIVNPTDNSIWFYPGN